MHVVDDLGARLVSESLYRPAAIGKIAIEAESCQITMALGSEVRRVSLINRRDHEAVEILALILEETRPQIAEQLRIRRQHFYVCFSASSDGHYCCHVRFDLC